MEVEDLEVDLRGFSPYLYTRCSYLCDELLSQAAFCAWYLGFHYGRSSNLIGDKDKEDRHSLCAVALWLRACHHLVFFDTSFIPGSSVFALSVLTCELAPNHGPQVLHCPTCALQEPYGATRCHTAE